VHGTNAIMFLFCYKRSSLYYLDAWSRYRPPLQHLFILQQKFHKVFLLYLQFQLMRRKQETYPTIRVTSWRGFLVIQTFNANTELCCAVCFLWKTHKHTSTSN